MLSSFVMSWLGSSLLIQVVTGEVVAGGGSSPTRHTHHQCQFYHLTPVRCGTLPLSVKGWTNSPAFMPPRPDGKGWLRRGLNSCSHTQGWIPTYQGQLPP